MFQEGTEFNINGLLLSVVRSQVIGNRLEIVADIIIEDKYDNKISTQMVLEQISQCKDKMKISAIISEWFVDNKIKLRQNVSIMCMVKKDLLSAQLRKIYKAGDTWQEIVSVLAYSMFDEFWSGVVARQYRILAGGLDKTKIPIYYQIKDRMIKSPDYNDTYIGSGDELNY